MFLVQEIWSVGSVFLTWRTSVEKRTDGQQQLLELFGLASGSDVAWYLGLEAPYIIAIVCIIVWPTKLVALPLLVLALYGSYQILISFLYFLPSMQQTPVAKTVAPVTIDFSGSLKILVELQQNVYGLLDNTAVTKIVFTGREQDHTEAKNLLRSLQDNTLAMAQFGAVLQGPYPLPTLLASGYLQALGAHRAAAARLYTLVFGTSYSAASSNDVAR